MTKLLHTLALTLRIRVNDYLVVILGLSDGHRDRVICPWKCKLVPKTWTSGYPVGRDRALAHSLQGDMFLLPT